MSGNRLSIGLAAKYLGVSVDTLRRWEAKGKIPVIRIGGRNRFFKLSDLDQIKFGDTLNISQAAKRLGMSASSLRRLSDQGVIEFIRDDNGYRRYQTADLEKYILQEKRFTGESLAEDQIHLSATEKKDPPLIRAKLLYLYNYFFAIKHLGLTAFSIVALLILFFVVSTSVLTYSFLKQPQKTAAFFGFNYQTKSDQVLGIASQEIDSSLKNATVTVFLPSAQTALKIATMINPQSVKNISLPQQPTLTTSQFISTPGSNGEDGQTGEKGTPGENGTTGKTGPIGIQGETGVKGDTGDTGATGPNGSFSGSYNSASGLQITAYGTNTGETTDLRFYGLAASGSEYIGLKSPDSITTSKIWTLPSADGSAGQCLSTNGSGIFSFANCASSAIMSLNGLTGSTQTFSTGTSGSDFNISSSGTTHTFNIPSAGASARGLVTTSSQTFGGLKTFSSNVNIQGNTTIGNSSDDTLTLNANSIDIVNSSTISLRSASDALAFGNLLYLDTLNQRLRLLGAYTTSNDARQLTIESSSNSDNQLALGFNTSGLYGSIQALIEPNNNLGTKLVINPLGGNVGVGGDLTPDSLFTVGSTSQFQVNSSGSIAVATGVTSSGTITFSGFTASRALFTTTGGQLTTSGTSQYLIDSISNETGTGNLVFSDSPTLTSPTISTAATVPTVIGGTGTTSTLTLRSTSGVGTTGSDIIFQTGNNGGTEAMRILNSGSIGVGNTSPLYKLSFASTTTDTTDGPIIGLSNTTNQRYSVGLGTSHTTGIGQALYFYTGDSGGNTTPLSGSAIRMTITGAGNVGIGNTAPALKLHVGSSAVTDSTNLLRLEDANSTCDFNANTGSPTCGSDLTLKKDVNSLDTEDLLTKISGLRPVSYHWKTDSGGEPLQFGFIAQEVAEKFPELVTDGKWVDGSTRKFLNMGGLMPYVIGAIREQQVQIAKISSGYQVLGVSADKSYSISDKKTVGIEERVSVLEKGVGFKFWESVEEIIFSGRVKFNEGAEFLANVVFKGQVTFSSDVASSVKVPEGVKKIKVSFNRTFGKIPIVTITPIKKITQEYSLSTVNKDYFIISFADFTKEEMTFNWTAFISEGPRGEVEVLEGLKQQTKLDEGSSANSHIDMESLVKKETASSPPAQNDIQSSASADPPTPSVITEASPSAELTKN